MDIQSLWSGALVVPAIVLALLARPAARAGRTSFGLGVRGGAAAEFGRGCLFSLPFVVLLTVAYRLTGLSEGPWTGEWLSAIGIAVYFLVLFLVEEVVFRGLLMTGLGVLTSQTLAWVVTAVLVAGAYLFASDTGVLAVVGAVVTNLLTGLARWRTGRIWWGLGQRWVWNAALVGLGFSDSAYRLEHPALEQHLHHATWLNGGAFGVEAGLIGIGFQVVMAVLVTRAATGRRGPWQVHPDPQTTVEPRSSRAARAGASGRPSSAPDAADDRRGGTWGRAPAD